MPKTVMVSLKQSWHTEGQCLKMKGKTQENPTKSMGYSPFSLFKAQIGRDTPRSHQSLFSRPSALDLCRNGRNGHALLRGSKKRTATGWNNHLVQRRAA